MDILRFKPNNQNENVEAHTVANLISLLPDGRYANSYTSFFDLVTFIRVFMVYFSICLAGRKLGRIPPRRQNSGRLQYIFRKLLNHVCPPNVGCLITQP